ncbi:MAG: hypothetical protein Q9181_006087 [Wetmoreana brouardii]
MEPSDDGSEGLRALLAFSLKASSSSGRQEAAITTNSNNPDRRPILEGILFSRKFILSYQLALLFLLAVFTIRHWTNWFRARNRRRAIIRANAASKTNEGSVVSSSSSTIQGTAPSSRTSVLHEDGEQMSLLAPGRTPSTRWQLGYRIRAFLAYQPRPIPLANKTLPSNETTLVVLVFAGLQAFYVFYRTPLSIPMLFVFADRTSLLFVANLPLLYLFAAKNQPIKYLTGYSYESLNIFHRRLGEVMCLLALLHSVGMVGVWYTILRPTGLSLARFLLSKIILLGLGAFVAYELIYFTSLGSFRQKWYELFLALHVVLQVVALVLVWFHHHNSQPYVGAALAIFLVDRLVYRMALKVRSVRALLEVTEDGATVLLRTTVSLTQKGGVFSYFTGQGINKGWRATDHVFLTVPALSRKHTIQAHPFTIASEPPQDGCSEAQLKLIIRAQDGFSGDLLRYAKGHSCVNIRLDGPYGSQNAFQLLQQCESSVIVAGGSGIAVALPLVWAVHGSHSSLSDMETGAKGRPSSNIVLIWVIRHQSHTSWVDPLELKSLQDAGVEVILPPPTEKHGHPDIPGMIESWTCGSDVASPYGKSRAGMVCSGPDSMNREVRNACSSLLARGHNIDVEVEKFGW